MAMHELLPRPSNKLMESIVLQTFPGVVVTCRKRFEPLIFLKLTGRKLRVVLIP